VVLLPVEGTSVVPPWYVRSTSVVPPCVRRRYYGRTTEVLRTYHGGTTEVLRRYPIGGFLLLVAEEGREIRLLIGFRRLGNVTETTEAGQGRDEGAVQRLVLQPGTLARGSLTARALTNGSGRGVGLSQLSLLNN